MIKKYLILFLIISSIALLGAGCISFKKTSEAGPMGVFKSLDKGEEWKLASNLPTTDGLKSISGIRSYRLFDDPSDPNAYYLGSRGQGLYYTYDNGNTWQAVNYMNKKFIYALAVNPKNKCVIYVSDGPSIFKTEDCSRSFIRVFSEQRAEEKLAALDIDPSNGYIYGAETGGDIIVSRDGGGSWQVLKRFDTALSDLIVDKQVPNRIYVASKSRGLYRSDDGGANWTYLYEGLKKFKDSTVFYRFQINPSEANSIFWISKYGILKSNDAGTSWNDLKLLTPPGAVRIYGFAVNPKNQNELYYTGTMLGEKNVHMGSTFYKSVDGGITWVTKKLPTNTIPVAIKVHPINDSTVFMAFAVISN